MFYVFFYYFNLLVISLTVSEISKLYFNNLGRTNFATITRFELLGELYSNSNNFTVLVQ